MSKPKNLERVNYELICAVREGSLEKARDLIKYGLSLSYSAGWSNGYVLLCDALERRHTEVAELLLRSGAEVNSRSNTCPSKTPLYYAARNGDIELVKIILDRGGYVDAKDNGGKTPLHYAVERQKIQVTELLLKHRADVDAKDNCGMTPLHHAVERGKIQVTELLLKHRADVDAKDNCGMTPLHHAVERGKIQATELLLKHRADVDASDKEGGSPLHLAVRTGSLEILKELLKYGAYVNCVYSASAVWKQGYSPLHLATERGSKEVVLLLLERGANVDIKGHYNITALHVAAQKGNTCIVEILLDHGACINSLTLRKGYSPLHFACKNRFETTVELLLKRGADVNAGTKQTPLHLAIINGDNFVVKLLLEHKATVDNLDEYGKTTLQLAVEKGHLAVVIDVLKCGPDISNESNRSSLIIAVQGHREENTEIVEALLEYGFNVSPEDANILSLLHTAVERGYLKIVKDLLKHGADVNMSFSSKEGFTPLHSAVKYKQVKLAQLFLNYEADINAQDKKGKTPIFYAIDNADLEMTNLLLTRQANINNSPNLLHIAVKKENEDIVEALLQHGADVNASDADGRTALHFTCTTDDCWKNTDSIKGQIAQLLLSNGANVDAQTETGSTTLFLAIREQYTKVVAAVLKYNANVNTVHKGYTCLHLAAQTGDKEICTMLINKGANIHAKANLGHTPLHVAAQFGHQEIIKTFLKNGANINTQDVNGKTALHFASQKGHEDAVVTLLKNGSDINITCKNNHTPLDYALAGVRDFYREVHTYDSDDDDYFDFDRGVCPFEVTAVALRRYIVQMKTANIFLSQKNLLSVNSYNLSREVANFQRDCEEEIANMKSEMIKDLHISFYDILVKSTSLAMYMRSKLIVQDLKSGHYKRKFPIYAAMIERQFRKGMQRKALIGQAIKLFNLLYPAVPCVCTEQIFSYLSVEDLRILLKAGRSLLK